MVHLAVQTVGRGAVEAEELAVHRRVAGCSDWDPGLDSDHEGRLGLQDSRAYLLDCRADLLDCLDLRG